MTREAAAVALAGLTRGLSADLAGERRLLERVSELDEAEALRAALVELGARALLETTANA